MYLGCKVARASIISDHIILLFKAQPWFRNTNVTISTGFLIETLIDSLSFQWLRGLVSSYSYAASGKNLKMRP